MRQQDHLVNRNICINDIFSQDKRLASGALELASSEVRFELDNNRNPTKISE
jgi:exoribonuclease R